MFRGLGVRGLGVRGLGFRVFNFRCESQREPRKAIRFDIAAGSNSSTKLHTQTAL